MTKLCWDLNFLRYIFEYCVLSLFYFLTCPLNKLLWRFTLSCLDRNLFLFTCILFSRIHVEV